MEGRGVHCGRGRRVREDRVRVWINRLEGLPANTPRRNVVWVEMPGGRELALLDDGTCRLHDGDFVTRLLEDNPHEGWERIS